MTREDAILHMTLRREELKHSVGDLDEDIKAFDMAIKALEEEPCEDAISRQAVEDAIYDYSRSCDVNYAQIMEYIDKIPSVSTENKEDIHREREQAYMKGYEDASKRYRTEPCGDAISRTDAIRVASGYCHWSNIPKELAKLPSVNTEKTGRWKWVQYDSNPNIGNWHCSECRTIIPHMPEETNNTPIYKWCSMCGARMIEPQESEGSDANSD